MNALNPRPIILQTTGIILGASASNQAISKDCGLTEAGSQHVRVDLICSGVTVGAGITAKLQHRSLTAWTDLAGANASVAITAAGEFSMTQCVERAADQANMPIKKQLRVVITTGAGSAVTIDNIVLAQGE